MQPGLFQGEMGLVNKGGFVVPSTSGWGEEAGAGVEGRSGSCCQDWAPSPTPPPHPSSGSQVPHDSSGRSPAHRPGPVLRGNPSPTSGEALPSPGVCCGHGLRRACPVCRTGSSAPSAPPRAPAAVRDQACTIPAVRTEQGHSCRGRRAGQGVSGGTFLSQAAVPQWPGSPHPVPSTAVTETRW